MGKAILAIFLMVAVATTQVGAQDYEMFEHHCIVLSQVVREVEGGIVVYSFSTTACQGNSAVPYSVYLRNGTVSIPIAAGPSEYPSVYYRVLRTSLPDVDIRAGEVAIVITPYGTIVAPCFNGNAPAGFGSWFMPNAVVTCMGTYMNMKEVY